MDKDKALLSLKPTTVNGLTIIDRTQDYTDKCELCGEKAELRPYGPNNAWICFFCAMEDEEGTERRMNAFLFGEGIN